MSPHVRALFGLLRRLAVPPDSDAALLTGWRERRDETASADPVPRHEPMLPGLGLLILAVGLGGGVIFLRGPGPELRAASVLAPSSPSTGDTPRRDRSGDPLPPGAVARLGSLRFRAPGEIVTLAVAPDGRTIAVLSYAGLFLFDASSGKRIKHLPTTNGSLGPGRAIVFAPDSRRLIGRGRTRIDLGNGFREKGMVRVWDLAGEQKVHDYDLEHVAWLGWSADGEPLAICLEPGALCLHELTSRRSRRFTCKDLPRPELSDYVACAGSADGRTLAMADERRAIHIWDTSTGQERRLLESKGDYYSSLTLAPDGSKLALVTSKTVQVLDRATAKVLYRVDAKDRYHSPVFSADGKLLALIDRSRSVVFWDAATGQERGRTRERFVVNSSYAISADGKTLVTAEQSSPALHLFDVATGALKSEPTGHRGRPFGTQFSPDGRHLATAGRSDGSIHIWDLATAQSVLRIQRPQWVGDIAYSSDGRSLFSTWSDDQVWVSDSATGQRQHVIKLEDPERPKTRQTARSMRLSDDGRTLVVLSVYYDSMREYQETLITGWDTATRKQVFRRRMSEQNPWTVLSADARTLALADTAGSSRTERLNGVAGRGPMRLEDVATGERLLTFPALEGQTWPLAFSPDGRLLAAINSDWRRGKAGNPAASGYQVHLRETATGAGVLTLDASDGNARVAFSADGRFLALTPHSQEILVWHLTRGRPVRRLQGFDADVTWLAFSPDGRRLVSGLADSTLLVWDLATGETAPSRPLGAEGLTRAWADLAGSDAARAFRARWALTASPDEALPFLKEYLRPARPADRARLHRLLADLESDQFALRDRAQADLEALGDLAEPALRQALAKKPTLETRRRVQAILDRLRGPVTQPELLRSLRALAVLEDVAMPAARKLLADLAAGTPESRLTQEARSSLSRLACRK